MIRMIETGSQFVCTSSGLALAGVGAMATQSDPSIISNNSLLPLSMFIGGIMFTALITWKASSARSSLMHKLEEMDRRIQSLEKGCGSGAGVETKIDMATDAIKDFKRRKRR